MPLDLLEFRTALGTFATGICVVAAAPPGEKPFGITINSFASVSLNPALILWSLQNDSECFNSFEKTGSFSANILSSDQQPLSALYAKKGAHLLSSEDYHIGATGTPVINNVVSSFQCNVWARYPGGDHIILVGEVMEMNTDPGKSPLVFHRGEYTNMPV